ncbi:impB/mucB/samB family protein [Peziza echinospora]|nr:impB/mucB/samB family protein [Peziza echinospora]
MPKGPESHDDRVILHIDYDCFYASVIENEQPALRLLPLGIQQKTILATCNYVARGLGVKKLQLVSEAKKACPSLVLVNGEDLTRFRDASKKIWLHVREFIWGHKAERLGFDELFLDVTEMIDFNLADVSLDRLTFFRLSPTDPTQGFPVSWNDLPALTYPNKLTNDPTTETHSSQSLSPVRTLSPRLILGAHLAAFLRKQIFDTFNHTCSAGISTNKLTAKLVGSAHKPDKQTVLIPEATQQFLDAHEIGKIPGIGHATAHRIRDALLQGGPVKAELDVHNPLSEKQKVSVRDVRTKLTQTALTKLLSSAPENTSTASRIWGWIHGVDNAPVNPTSLIPSQISIEDTFRSLRSNPTHLSPDILVTLTHLTAKLLRRMKVDLLSPNNNKKWMACPKTFRLSIRLRDKGGGFGKRISRSAGLPGYVFDVDIREEVVAERLVKDTVGGLMRRLLVSVGTGQGEMDVQLVNVAVVNMASGGDGGGSGGGADIGRLLFGGGGGVGSSSAKPPGEDEDRWEEEVREIERVYAEKQRREQEMQTQKELEAALAITCQLCGTTIPPFMAEAHARFHDFEEED